MKKLVIPILGLWLSCLFPACTSSDHFLKETDYRQKVETDFNQKKKFLPEVISLRFSMRK